MSEVQKQVTVLWNLKNVAEKIVRIKADLEKVPLEIEKLKETLKTATKVYDSEKNKIASLEKVVREAERDAKVEAEFLAKSESKLAGVTNTVEFTAASKENEDRKKIKAKNEETTLKAQTDLQAKLENLKTLQPEVDAIQTKTQAECAVLETDLGNLQNELKTLESTQAEELKGLAPNLSVIFKRLSLRGKGAPIAQVAEGMCLSCHVRVRPQLYNEVIGHKQIHQCSHCGKLLVGPVTDGEATNPIEELSA